MTTTPLSRDWDWLFFLPDDDDDDAYPAPPDQHNIKLRGLTNMPTTQLSKETAEQLAKAQIALAQAEAARLRFDLKTAKAENENFQADADNARIYTFYEPVGEQSVKRAMRELGHWSRRDPEQPIKIVFNSPGGSVLDGLALFDYIQQLRDQGHEITTVGLGMAASMGGILLQAGDWRVMGKNAWMLIHEVSSVAWGKASEQEDQLKFVRRLQDRCVEILASRANISKDQIKRKWKKLDWWLSAEEALEAGFVDEVV